MKLKKVKEELWKIGSVFPTMAGIMTKVVRVDGEDQTVGHQWARQMTDLDEIHFENLIDEYATMKLPLPDPSDRLPYEIIRICKDRMAREVEKLEQYEKYHQQKPLWNKHVSRSLWCRVVKFLLVNKTTPEQGEELSNWSIGDGPAPEWLTDSQKRRFFAKDFDLDSEEKASAT